LNSKPFRAHVFAACAAYFPSGDPFVDIAFYKETFQQAAQVAARALRASARGSASAQASAVAAAARALHRNDWSTLRRAFKTLPDLQPLFAQRGPEVYLTNVAGYAALSQTILSRVASGRLTKAISCGAPRPKIERLLAISKSFAPFRRRDTLGAVILLDGSISSDREVMSVTLATHWGRAFEGSNTSAAHMEAFCDRNTTIVDATLLQRPTLQDVHGSIRRGKNSAPGPDGIRASVWSRFSTCVSGAFFDAVTQLSNDISGPGDLNDSLAVYIPKKGLHSGVHGLQAKASEARPLALKNSSSKVLWRTLARSVSPALMTWAHVTQRGFVAGRIPGHGVIDVDTASRVISVLHELGVLSLYDFTSAFPSVSRSFILLVMQYSGFLAWSISLISASWAGAKMSTKTDNLFT
jgi:hypothetical protein